MLSHRIYSYKGETLRQMLEVAGGSKTLGTDGWVTVTGGASVNVFMLYNPQGKVTVTHIYALVENISVAEDIRLPLLIDNVFRGQYTNTVHCAKGMLTLAHWQTNAVYESQSGTRTGVYIPSLNGSMKIKMLMIATKNERS